MAHEITASDRMIYVGKKPWHDVGVAMATPPKSVGEMLELAGLAGWNLRQDQLFTADGRPVDRFAIVRGKDESILGTVGPDYEISPNETAFRPLEPLISANLATVETAGSIRGGSRVWCLLKLNKPNARIIGNDEVAKYVLCAVGHDGSLGWYFGETFIRVVCSNTLSASIARDGFRMLRLRHTANINAAIEAATMMVGKLDEHFEKAAEVLRYMARIRITEAQLIEYVDAVFPAPKTKVIAPPTMAIDASQIDGAAELSALLSRPALARESSIGADGAPTIETTRRIHTEIKELFHGKAIGSDLDGCDGTAYQAYNAVTEYISHHRGHDGKGQAAETRANNLWFGDIGTRAATQAAKIFLPA